VGIGGGAGGKYVVYFTDDNFTFHNLINPANAASFVEFRLPRSPIQPACNLWLVLQLTWVNRGKQSGYAKNLVE
jgi:hypothetical protein